MDITHKTFAEIEVPLSPMEIGKHGCMLDGYSTAGRKVRDLRVSFESRENNHDRWRNIHHGVKVTTKDALAPPAALREIIQRLEDIEGHCVDGIHALSMRQQEAKAARMELEAKREGNNDKKRKHT